MKHLATINKYFWKYRWRLLLGFIFVILTNYFRILSPQLTGYIIDTVVANIKSGQQNGPVIYAENFDYLVKVIIQNFNTLSFQNKIFFTGLILIILAVISGIFMFLMRQSIIVMSRLIEFDQKNEIYTHYQQLDLSFYKVHNTGDLMNRISEDVSRVRMYTGPAIMYFINLAAVIGFSIYFMFQSDVRLTLVALCPLPFLACTIYYVNTIIHKKSERIQTLLSSLTSNAQESFSGIRVIKSFVQEKSMLHFFQKNSEAYRENAVSLATPEAIYFPSMALLIGLSTVITIMVGSLDVINNLPGASVGKIAEFVLYIQMLTFPVSAIGWIASFTQRASASQKRINEFLYTVPAIKDGLDIVEAPLTGNIEIRNAAFTYAHTGISAIRNFSLNIKAGQKIAIIGKTGSGKSTIVQLLLHLYELNQGEILYDGIPVKKIALHQLRTKISYVPQDIFLFSDTVFNNIRFGKSSATREEVIQAAKSAGIYNEIVSFEKSFETIVGERGVTLSGGQKQRISIARAMLKEPGILILDDCLSAVDSKTEQEIINNLYHYLQNNTAIIVTHRIFTLFKFDKIIVLDAGEIAESGTHEELMANKGLYFDIFQLQQHENREMKN